MDAGAFLIEQQRQKYASDLTAWASSVIHAPSAPAALTQARREPHAGNMIRGLGGMTSSARSSAMRRIDGHLADLLAKAPEGQTSECLRLAQGMANFPEVMRWKRDTERKAAAERQEGRIEGRRP